MDSKIRALVAPDHYFFYHVYLLLYIKRICSGSVANEVIGKVNDLGSIPGLHPFHLFFPNLRSYAGMIVWSMMRPSIQPYTRPGTSDQRHRLDEHPKPSSTRMYVSCQKVKRAILNGPEFLKYTSYLGTDTPKVWPNFVIFYLFIIYYLPLIIILFVHLIFS